ncbi:hypothetical protein [Streptomyces ochraceiscleroticus]|uniref:Uncharacterized protein n=1 Tax=Streptomyces ochraceiscleroticus TaxID=47761 RepID=A0ABW1MWX6_9ACTN|nr:hypothetical protein [Streptomyces ochraceiscleroticus]
MSFLRRAAAASVIAVALATCGAAPSALAAPSTSSASSASAAVPSDGEPGARPIQMGPFMFPSTGQLQGGFGWNTSGGGY